MKLVAFKNLDEAIKFVENIEFWENLEETEKNVVVNAVNNIIKWQINANYIMHDYIPSLTVAQYDSLVDLMHYFYNTPTNDRFELAQSIASMVAYHQLPLAWGGSKKEMIIECLKETKEVLKKHSYKALIEGAIDIEASFHTNRINECLEEFGIK